MVRIPNRPWKILEFPIEIDRETTPFKEDGFYSVIWRICLPEYHDSLSNSIACKLQDIIYETKDDAKTQNEMAIKSFVRTMVKKCPQLQFGDIKRSFWDHDRTFWEFFRFSHWSLIPGELLQARATWSDADDNVEEQLELQFNVLFDQRKINKEHGLYINRKGFLGFDILDWRTDFDASRVANDEIPDLEPIRNNSSINSVSSDNSSTISECFNPKKKPRMEHRFVISSTDEE